MHASALVGRVGGLAVALGIGAAAFGAATPAWAAPAGDSGSSTAADTTSAVAPASKPAAGPRSRAGRAAGPAASATRKNSSPAVSAPTPAVPAQSTDRTAARVLAPGAVSNLVGAQAEIAGAVMAPAAVSALLNDAPAAAPVMTPPAVVAPVAGVAQSVLGSLLGTDPGAPEQTPLSWAVLAVARRPEQRSAAKVADATVADATVATATADANGSIYFNQTPSLSYTLNPGQSSTGVVTGTLVGVDPDSSPLAYSVVSAPSHGSVAVGADGTFTYTPDASAAATGTVDTFTAGVSDAGTGFHIHGVAGLLNLLTFGLLGDPGHTATTRVTVTVQPVGLTGTAVVGTPDPTTGVVTGTVTSNDPSTRLTYSGSTTTTKGAVVVNANTGAFTYTPTSSARHAAAKVGATTAATTDNFTITVTDAVGGTTAVPVTVTISPKNSAPVAGTTTVGTPNSTTGVVTGTVTATDADRDTLSYAAPATTTKGSVSVNASTGAFTYTPTSAARGAATSSTTDNFTVTVTDGYGGSTPIAVTVPVSPQASTPSSKVTYVFNYTDGSNLWTPEAKASLQNAADQVAAYIVVSQPVTLTFEVTALNDPNSDTMASAGSEITGSRAGFYNTVVQNKILTGTDTNGSQVDGTIDVNFGTGYAFGDIVGPNQYDFKSTMMHEMLHAYGFLSYIDEAGYNSRTVAWTKFDSFIGTKSGTKVINLSGYKFNTAYNANLTGGAGGLFFLGPAAIAAYGGPVPLYTPSDWSSGSSVSHLDDDTFTGVNAQLMNAMADKGLGIRTLSTIELGILTDLGYTVKQNPASASVLFVGLIFLRRRRR